MEEGDSGKTLVELTPGVKKTIEEKPFIQTRSRIIPTETKNPKSQTSINSDSVKNIRYRYIGKESLIDLIRKTLPKEFTPTKRTGEILGWIFLGAIILGLLRFPVDSIFSENMETDAIKIGIPLAFLKFDLVDADSFPLLIFGLIVDILFYIVLAYLVDILINYMDSQAKSLTARERDKHPEILKVSKKEENFGEKVIKKIFGE